MVINLEVRMRRMKGLRPLQARMDRTRMKLVPTSVEWENNPKSRCRCRHLSCEELFRLWCSRSGKHLREAVSLEGHSGSHLRHHLCHRLSHHPHLLPQLHQNSHYSHNNKRRVQPRRLILKTLPQIVLIAVRPNILVMSVVVVLNARHSGVDILIRGRHELYSQFI